MQYIETKPAFPIKIEGVSVICTGGVLSADKRSVLVRGGVDHGGYTVQLPWCDVQTQIKLTGKDHSKERRK